MQIPLKKGPCSNRKTRLTTIRLESVMNSVTSRFWTLGNTKLGNGLVPLFITDFRLLTFLRSRPFVVTSVTFLKKIKNFYKIFINFIQLGITVV